MIEIGQGTLLTLYGAAIGLGARHAIDPDHLTVIDGIARRNVQDRPFLARLGGVVFSLGHGMVVLLVAATAVLLESRWRLPFWLELSGMIISVLVLVGLGIANLRIALTAPRHQKIAPIGWKARILGTGGDHPIAILGLGMLFALSLDTLAQAGLLGVAAVRLGGLANVAATAICFACGMMVAGGLNGLWIAQLVQSANRHAATASRIMTGTIGLINLVIGLVTFAAVASPAIGVWNRTNALWVGCGVALLASLAYAAAMAAHRLKWGRALKSSGLGKPSLTRKRRDSAAQSTADAKYRFGRLAAMPHDGVTTERF